MNDSVTQGKMGTSNASMKKTTKINSNKLLSEKETEEYNRLLETERELEKELAKLKAELEAGPSIKETIEDLHEYNDIKDATQVVLGAMATMHGVTIASLHKEFNVPLKED
ncbi:DNA repair protein SWI5 homolog [Chelonus insularis]|uniref:DNA repair protein SWI5 homolog n=1 Tax=Chelonus insularis TaxID=460826 RepID=UPI00158AED1F|nr:DNA repair protein SWI5 homolog [Chelonus insularis]